MNGQAGRVIHENAGRVGRNFFRHVFHCLVLFLPGCVLPDAGTGKNVKSGLVADVALHCAEDGRFIWNFANASFAQRQRHVGNRCPDKHDDSTENAGKKNFHLKVSLLPDKRFATS